MRKTIILLIGLLSLQAFAETQLIVEQGKGIAPTRDEAIKKAVFEAVAKAKGINIGSGGYVFSYESASASIDKKTITNGVGLDAVSIQTAGITQLAESKALIKTFEILEEKRPDPNNNVWEVTVNVSIYDFQPLDKDKVRIAVMTPATLSNEYSFDNTRIGSREIQQEIMHQMNGKLAGTNQISVLDRTYIDKVLQEKELVWNGNASLEEKAKFCNILGADYILTSTVTDIQIVMTESYLEAIGQKTRQHWAQFKMDYSLISAATTQIKFSDSINLAIDDKGIGELVPGWYDDNYRQLVDAMINSAVNSIVSKITSGLCPVKIAKILPGGVIVINKGGNDIAESDIYEVLKQGQELFDYDTKKSLGKTEQAIAQIKITKAMSNFSYAQLVISYDNSVLTEGLICRKVSGGQAAQYQQPIQQKTDTEVTPSGGVKMPFDK